MMLSLDDRLKLYCAPRGVSVESVRAGQTDEELTQFLNNHEIPTQRFDSAHAIMYTRAPQGLDMANPAAHCHCTGMKAINPDDVRVLWWQQGVIDELRNTNYPNNDDAAVQYRLLWLGYLVKLGELLGEKRLAEAPTALKKLNAAWAVAQMDWIARFHRVGGPTIEDVLLANGVHGDCPISFQSMRARCDYFYKHTSF